MSLTFKISKGNHLQGSLVPQNPTQWKQAKRIVEALIHRFQLGELDFNSCLTTCRNLLQQNPTQLDALFFLMDCRLMTERSRGSLASDFLRYLEPVLDLIGDFNGPLDPVDDNTIIFLSCHYTLIMALVRSERYSEALDACLRHSKWDSANDDVDAFIGNLYILLEKYDKAEDFLTTYPIPMPYESVYSLALVQFIRGRYNMALETLRKAFITQPYVAEIILSNSCEPVEAWNLPNNHASHLNAFGYINVFLGEEIWQKNEKAIPFLSWAYYFPEMMEERARAFALLNQQRYITKKDQSEKDRILSEFYRMADTLNPKLVEKVLRPLMDKGRLVKPWEKTVLTLEEDSKPHSGFDLPDLDRQFFFHPGPKDTKYPCLSCESYKTCVDFDEKLDKCPWQDKDATDCGDCSDCESFEECSESPTKEDVDCTECSECEIEGFCSSSNPEPPKGPRYRH
ncbi:MAG: tetratricopeptide repeat protein [Deltaproteobacteria bacterium]|nr:tetratricopeptide repeat protein [Deltaproteobacteria bacterium]